MTKQSKIMLKNLVIAILVLLSIVALIANMVLATKFPNCGANIFTAISGWVSGIATIVLGIIAVFQNKKYNKENSEYLKKQQDINNEYFNRQNLNNSQHLLLENLENYKTIIIKCFDKFSELNIEELANKICCETSNLISERKIIVNKMTYFGEHMQFILLFAWVYFTSGEDLYISLKDYISKVTSYLSDDKTEVTFDIITQQYHEVCLRFNLYISSIDGFMYDWDILKDPDTFIKIVDTLHQKQVEWLKKIKNEENKNNG